MKIYRIPKSEAEKFHHSYDPMNKTTNATSEQYVNDVDLAEKIEPWHGEKCVRIDISNERSKKKSVIFIVFKESDVITLHQGLIKGLQEKRDSWEVSERGRMIDNTFSTFFEPLRKMANDKRS